MSYFGEHFWVSKAYSYFGRGSWKVSGVLYGGGSTRWFVGRESLQGIEVKVGRVRLGLNLHP